MDPSKEGLLPPPDLSGERARITAENVIKAQDERARAYISLMDQIEAGVGEQGQYFIKFGQRSYAGKDTRALLLIKSVVDPKDGNNLFIAITREGPKCLRFVPQDKNPQDQDETGEEAMKNIIQEMLKPIKATDGSYDRSYGLKDNGDLLIGHRNNSEPFHFPNNGKFPTSHTEVLPVDIDTVKIAIEDSQRTAEIPYFIKLKQEQQRLTDSAVLRDVIKKLPLK